MSTRFKLTRERIVINDETLRDGEQTAGITFLKEDKVAIAQLIADTLPGSIINSGYPPISDAEFEAVQAVARNVTGAQIECAGRATKQDFSRCYEAVKDAETPRVSFWFPTSRLMLDTRMGKSQNDMLDHALSILNYGRDLVQDRCGIDVALADVSRAEVDFVIEACTRLHENGADMLVLCDTIGRMLPHEVYDFIHKVTSAVPDAGIIFHGHHDLGNGTANCVVALQAGAMGVATAVNGLGERAGMPPTEEVIANLLLRADAFDASRKFEADSTKLLALSQLVGERSNGYPHPNKPVVGTSVLRRETGTQVDWMQRDARTFQLVSPDFLGQEQIELVIGKMSSHGSLRLALQERGIELTDEELAYAFQAVKELTGRKKTVDNKDISRIVSEARQFVAQSKVVA